MRQRIPVLPGKRNMNITVGRWRYSKHRDWVFSSLVGQCSRRSGFESSCPFLRYRNREACPGEVCDLDTESPSANSKHCTCLGGVYGKGISCCEMSFFGHVVLRKKCWSQLLRGLELNHRNSRDGEYLVQAVTSGEVFRMRLGLRQGRAVSVNSIGLDSASSNSDRRAISE